MILGIFAPAEEMWEVLDAVGVLSDGSKHNHQRGGNLVMVVVVVVVVQEVEERRRTEHAPTNEGAESLCFRLALDGALNIPIRKTIIIILSSSIHPNTACAAIDSMGDQ